MGLFYIQRSGYVGNNLLFWRKGGGGYTCHIDEAEQYTKEKAARIVKLERRKFKMRSVAIINKVATRQVDMQKMPVRRNA